MATVQDNIRGKDEDRTPAELKSYYSKLEGWISIVINTILAVIKYWAGIVSGSVALIADAWHTLSDTISSVIVIIGAKISAKPADDKHPFGHGRFEFISTFIIAVLLFVVAYSFARESVVKLINREQAHYGLSALLVTIGSVLMKEVLAQIAFFCGKRSGSLTLNADGWHHRSDAISSLIILVGIIMGKHVWWVDGVLGIAVAILIAWTAYRFTSTAISAMLGEEPDKKLLNRVMEIAGEIAGEGSNAHHFHFHDYVTHQELTFHLRLNRNLNIDQAHATATRIEQKIFDELNINATIHIEPIN